jgi:hypothetical protein
MVSHTQRILIAMALCAIASAPVFAAKISDITKTKHNLSSSGSGPVTSAESQICVFCHTPHQANADAKAPLWNRALSSAPYTDLYESGSIDAYSPGSAPPPNGSSKLCLSCHDGTVAIGKVGVLNGVAYDTGAAATPAIDMTGTGVGADDKLTTTDSSTGFTRNLGTSLSNDHPISFTYDATLAANDGELLDPVAASHIGTGTPRHPIPLEAISGVDKVQCTSCHDPHIRDTDPAKNAKFLRLNRFQESASVSQGSFLEATDQICLGCHSKTGWSTSAHAVDSVANEVYTDAAADLREFPRDLPVWQAGCLNCHDTHTVQGAKRLLREGTTNTNIPKQGGSPAQEQTCYQCHTTTVDGGQVLKSTTLIGDPYAVPDIKSDFTTAGHKAMPIATTEVHEVTNSDLKESQALLNTRHVECTDCHNPHRVIRNSRADGTGSSTSGTHEHTSSAMHTNTASGVLKGMWGVDSPTVASLSWGTNPTYSVVDRVTKEYQVCLKCHSSYAYGTTPPFFANTTENPNGTLNNTNGFTTTTRYTDQGMEFQAPTNDQGETTATHRSWHPVIASTGRTATSRKLSSNAADQPFLDPWGDSVVGNIGAQTMYCTDCHGSNTTGTGTRNNGSTTGVSGGTATPDGDNPWGPHGSANNFILKGTWDNATGNADATSGLCFKCHNWSDYADPANNAPKLSGFRKTTAGGGAACANLPLSTTNLHIGHAQRIGRMECTWCHVAIPHGWKNKALLADVSQDGCAAPCSANPYYQQAMLGFGGTVTWRLSGQWTANDCGGATGAGSMANTCANPP